MRVPSEKNDLKKKHFAKSYLDMSRRSPKALKRFEKYLEKDIGKNQAHNLKIACWEYYLHTLLLTIILLYDYY